MKKITLQNIVWKEGKYFIAQCIYPDVCSFGKTKKEALAMLAEALKLYFEEAPKEKINPIRFASIERQTVSYV